MTNKKNKSIRIFAWFGAIVFAIVLAFMPFCFNSRARTDITYADSIDTSYSFTGSYIPLNSISYDRTGDVGFGPYNILKPNIAFSFSSDDTHLILSTKIFPFSTWLSSTNGFNNSHLGYSETVLDVPYGLRVRDLIGITASNFVASLTDNSINNVGIDVSTFTLNITKTNLTNFSIYYPYSFELCDYNNVNDGGTTASSFIEIHGSALFTVPDSLHIYYNDSYNVLSNGTKLYYVATYQFIDKLGNSVYISFPLDQNQNTLFSPRTYYFYSELDDNSYYQQGRADGYTDGYTAGDSDGYNRGYNAGYSVGERAGYNDGVEHSNDYTFLGLFGAIVDAPLTALFGYIDKDINSPTYHQRVGGLLNFTLSFDGVHYFDLKGFFLAILAIAIVVSIIRFALSK